MQRSLTHKFVPFFALLLVASIFLLNTTYASAATDDIFEDNDTIETSWLLGPGEYSGLYQGDDDFYAIDVPKYATLKVTITYNGTMNNMELEFYNEYGFMFGSYSDTNNETLEHTAMDMERIQFLVYGWDNFEAYNMSIELIPFIADVEPNNYIYEASEIWPSYHAGNNQSDADWYQIWVNPDDDLEMWLYYDHGPGNLVMELFDEYETILLNATEDYLYWDSITSGQFLYFRISQLILELTSIHMYQSYLNLKEILFQI